MKATMLGMLLQVLSAVLTEDLLKELADKILDFVEDRVLGSASTVDDMLVLPVCALIRKTFNIPDNDEE